MQKKSNINLDIKSSTYNLQSSCSQSAKVPSVYQISQDLYEIFKIIHCHQTKKSNLQQYYQDNKENRSDNKENCSDNKQSEIKRQYKSIHYCQSNQLNETIEKLNKTELQRNGVSQREESQKTQKIYEIPQRYIQSLKFLVKQFLNFKVCCKQGTNLRRGRTACKTSLNKQRFKNDLLQSKQGNTTNFLISKQKIKKELFQTFSIHFEVQKEITAKIKKINQLEQQLILFKQKLNEKNQIIRSLQQKQLKQKVKFKDQIQKINKTKNSFQLQLFKEKNQNSKQSFLLSKIHLNSKMNNFFHINGEKLQTQNKTCDFKSQKQKKINYELKQNQSNIIQSKINLKKKGKTSKRQNICLQELVQKLNNQIRDLNRQKQITLDKLTQNAAKIQKYIQEIQKKLNDKQLTLNKCKQQLKFQNHQMQFQQEFKKEKRQQSQKI